MKKQLLISTSASLAFLAFMHAGPADDIAAKHAKASAEELEAYLKKNPTAEDKSDAINYLLEAYNRTGNDARTLELLQARFEAIPSGETMNPQALYSTTSMLFRIMLDSGDKGGATKLIDSALAKSKGHKMARQLEQAFNKMKGKLEVPTKGDTMEIKFTSLQGKEVDLAAMKGKVVLIDFWATWCAPCIAELPNVIKAYEKYHDQGFEIIGISLDKEEDKEKLEKFIADKKMPWPQYFDGKGWANDLVKKYKISGIPATFLIGPDGKIVATNLRGNALEKAVGEHIAK